MPLPDLIPRLGANISYFALAVIRQLEKLGVYCCNGSHAIEMVRISCISISYWRIIIIPYA